MTDSAPDLSALTGFASNPLDRLSEKRDDAAFMAGLLADPAARILLFCNDTPLLRRHDPLFSPAEAAAMGATDERIFLGTGPRGPLFAGLIEKAAEGAPDAWRQPDVHNADGTVQIDLRSLAVQGRLPPDLLGALGQAKSAQYWHRTHRFCARCGAPTRMANSGWRRECDACKAQHFPRTDPVVIMLATQGDSCLLGRQARFPPGMYSCLAGFLEPGETIEDAVRRELFEEAGVRAGPVRYVSSQPWPFPASLMIGCVAQVSGRDLAVDGNELEDARWFSRAECVAILAGRHPAGVVCPPPMAIAHQLMKVWVDRHGERSEATQS